MAKLGDYKPDGQERRIIDKDAEIAKLKEELEKERAGRREFAEKVNRATDVSIQLAAELRGRHDAMEKLLHRFVDHEDRPCGFDHHGFCQVHDSDDPCAVAQGRALLALKLCTVCDGRECAKGCDMCPQCIDELIEADEAEWRELADGRE
jgi:hypothetical protein